MFVKILKRKSAGPRALFRTSDPRGTFLRDGAEPNPAGCPDEKEGRDEQCFSKVCRAVGRKDEFILNSAQLR